MKQLLGITLSLLVNGWLFSCSPARQISRELQTKPIYTDHFTGVALYDPTEKRTLVQHNADKPFTPASNTKLVSFYAGLLALPDSLPALRYIVRQDSLIFWGTGNPLLLHPDLPDTTALAFLRNRPEKLFFSAANYGGPRFGAGWAWDDYNGDYSPELAPLPVYGNVVRFQNGKSPAQTISPARFADSVCVSTDAKAPVGVHRSEFSNQFVRSANSRGAGQDVPFHWSAELAAQLLADTLHKPVGVLPMSMPGNTQLLRGASTDSLYKRMLHVSDNQFAEQILFMISSEQNKPMLEPVTERKRLIDSVLHYTSIGNTRAKWVDGSGLSRYNLFTPNVMIDLLSRIWAKILQQRLFALLSATGQAGTSAGKPYVFAKSGSMTGVYNLSGYVLTRRGKVLYFSIMHNNFTQTVSEMRGRTANLLQEIHRRF